jgi:hypothetical protein
LASLLRLGLQALREASVALKLQDSLPGDKGTGRYRALQSLLISLTGQDIFERL